MPAAAGVADPSLRIPLRPPPGRRRCRPPSVIPRPRPVCLRSCGTVVVDAPGTYLTASLLLTGCVHLRLPDNVTLLAGDRVRRFRAVRPAAGLRRRTKCLALLPPSLAFPAGIHIQRRLKSSSALIGAHAHPNLTRPPAPAHCSGKTMALHSPTGTCCVFTSAAAAA